MTNILPSIFLVSTIQGISQKNKLWYAQEYPLALTFAWQSECFFSENNPGRNMDSNPNV